VQTRALHAYLRRRNANARHPGVLAVERKERARIRSEKGIRWADPGSPPRPERPGEPHALTALAGRTDQGLEA
jgi:hypothetical protein